MTKILKCNCVSEFQDKTYGVGNRVFNESEKGATCTVCGSYNSGKSSIKK